jgi:hypothetical protein
MRKRYAKPGGLKAVFAAVGAVLILTSFTNSAFEIKRFLLGAVFIALGIVLFKRKKLPESYTSIVYITRSGSKYHSYKGCSALRSAAMIGETTLGDAVNSGLTACDKCM